MSVDMRRVRLPIGYQQICLDFRQLLDERAEPIHLKANTHYHTNSQYTGLSL
jgi:hypothetical protein